LDSDENLIRTKEVLDFLDDMNRTMTYSVLNAPGTPFEGLVNKIEVISLPDDKSQVTFTGTMLEKDDNDEQLKKKKS
jgi:hypothetical protein